MNKYKIIGADGRQYGPVTADELRAWIAGSRANAQTLVQVEGSTEWKPLSTYPEFATAIPVAAAPPQVQAFDNRRSKLAAGLLGIFLGAWGVHRFYLGYIGIGIAQIVVTLCTCGIGGFWGLIEGILILCKSTITTDAEGKPLKDD